MYIEMENVALKREKKWILEDINWQVAPGQHWALLGMNGAGKTTLLNLVCGYLFPTKGTLQVFGHTFGRYPLQELRKQIGWVSMSLAERMRNHAANNGLEMVLSGKYASIGLYERPSDEDVEQAAEILEGLAVPHLKKQAFANMSQGEKQRVLIGRALMARPRLLILDEPCAGLDFLSKEQLLTSIEQMADREQTTILYVTHQIDEILPLFTHTLLLKDGQVFSQGPTAEQLTSATLSAFCETPIQVNHEHDRYSLSLQKAVPHQ